MKLKKDLELVPFLKDVKQCQADVWLITQKEDRLNLKSLHHKAYLLHTAIFDTMHFGCHAG